MLPKRSRTAPGVDLSLAGADTGGEAGTGLETQHQQIDSAGGQVAMQF